MVAVYDNTGVQAGSDACKLCVSHGCEGYKKAMKNNIIDNLFGKTEYGQYKKNVWIKASQLLEDNKITYKDYCDLVGEDILEIKNME